jgi:hypothetical protein
MNTACFLSISRCLREQVKLLQRRKGNWDNEYCIEFPCLMKSTQEHYGLLQILQTRLFHSAQWLGWLSAPQCSTIKVKFYEKLWLQKKITNYWHLNFFLLIAPKRGWHLCTSIKASPCDTNDNVCLDFQNWHYSIFKTFSIEVETDDWSRKER